MAKTSDKSLARQKRVKRIRKSIHGSLARPRMRVFKSSKHIYVQLVDDVCGNTICSASSMVFSVAEDKLFKGKVEQAKRVGLLIAEYALSKNIFRVVFDRGGYIYHGRVRSLCEGAREGGLIF